jgi:hypothetical protein
MKLFFDIETIPDQRPGAFDRYLDAVEPPANYKKQETIDKWMLENAENVALENFKKTGLTGLHGEICSIAWALDDNDIFVITRGLAPVETEHELIDLFWNHLLQDIREVADREERANWPRLEWIGHNVLDFDLRFLKQRSIVRGIKPAHMIPADARHGGDHVFDTMKEWAGWRGYVKQDELIEALGIPAPDWIDEDILSIDGSKVWEIYREEDYGLIAEYNRLDVHYVREIHRRMTYAT